MDKKEIKQQLYNKRKQHEKTRNAVDRAVLADEIKHLEADLKALSEPQKTEPEVKPVEVKKEETRQEHVDRKDMKRGQVMEADNGKSAAVVI